MPCLTILIGVLARELAHTNRMSNSYLRRARELIGILGDFGVETKIRSRSVRFQARAAVTGSGSDLSNTPGTTLSTAPIANERRKLANDENNVTLNADNTESGYGNTAESRDEGSMHGHFQLSNADDYVYVDDEDDIILDGEDTTKDERILNRQRHVRVSHTQTDSHTPIHKNISDIKSGVISDKRGDDGYKGVNGNHSRLRPASIIVYTYPTSGSTYHPLYVEGNSSGEVAFLNDINIYHSTESIPDVSSDIGGDSGVGRRRRLASGKTRGVGSDEKPSICVGVRTYKAHKPWLELMLRALITQHTVLTDKNKKKKALGEYYRGFLVSNSGFNYCLGVSNVQYEMNKLFVILT